MSKKTDTKDRTETRFIPTATFEVRAVEGEDEGERRKIVGHVAVFNQWSPVYGDFREQIAPTFFDGVLADESMDVRALYNHDRNYVLGRRGNGTLRLDKDDIGLLMDNDPPDTSYARDLLNLLDRQDVAGGSFSFRLPEDGTGDAWEKGEDGIMERTLLRAEWVGDVGPVAEPFYPTTSMAARSLDAWRAEHEAREAAAEEEAAEPGEAEVAEEVELVASVEPAAASEAGPEPVDGGTDAEGEQGGEATAEPQEAAPVEVRDEEAESEACSEAEPETIALEIAQRFQQQAALKHPPA